MLARIRPLVKKLQRAVEARRQDQASVAQAISYFESTYHERARQGMSRVIHRDDDKVVVRICYGDSRPPMRHFFAISRTDEITKVEFEAVGRYGEKPWL